MMYCTEEFASDPKVARLAETFPLRHFRKLLREVELRTLCVTGTFTAVVVDFFRVIFVKLYYIKGITFFSVKRALIGCIIKPVSAM